MSSALFAGQTVGKPHLGEVPSVDRSTDPTTGLSELRIPIVCTAPFRIALPASPDSYVTLTTAWIWGQGGQSLFPKGCMNMSGQSTLVEVHYACRWIHFWKQLRNFGKFWTIGFGQFCTGKAPTRWDTTYFWWYFPIGCWGPSKCQRVLLRLWPHRVAFFCLSLLTAHTSTICEKDTPVSLLALAARRIQGSHPMPKIHDRLHAKGKNGFLGLDGVTTRPQN